MRDDKNFKEFNKFLKEKQVKNYKIIFVKHLTELWDKINEDSNSGRRAKKRYSHIFNFIKMNLTPKNSFIELESKRENQTLKEFNESLNGKKRNVKANEKNEKKLFRIEKN